MVNALKLAAANAERMLALHFDRYYQNPKDTFSIFRGLLQLPGVIRAAGPDRVEVQLQRPDSPKVAEALATLLTDLNTQNPRMLGSGPILTFLCSTLIRYPHLPTVYYRSSEASLWRDSRRSSSMRLVYAAPRSSQAAAFGDR